MLQFGDLVTRWLYHSFNVLVFYLFNFFPLIWSLCRMYTDYSIVSRLIKLPVNRGKQNKTAILKYGGEKMRSERQRNLCWWVDYPLSYFEMKVQHVSLFLCVLAFLVEVLKNMVIVFIGRRSQGSESQRRGSCCIGVWQMERGIFCRCWRYCRKWSTRWRPGSAFWLCRIHKGGFLYSTYKTTFG